MIFLMPPIMNQLPNALNVLNSAENEGQIDAEFQESVDIIKEQLSNKFWENDIDEFLEDQLNYILSTNSYQLKLNRLDYIKFLTEWLEEKFKSYVKNKENITHNTVSDYEDFKEKIISWIDKQTLEWKMKAAVELIITESWEFEEWYEKNPFYVDENSIRVKLHNIPNYKKGDSNFIAFDFWHDFTVLENIDSPTEIARQLNSNFNDVVNILAQSTGAIKKFPWLIYEIVSEPKNIYKYSWELS